MRLPLLLAALAHRAHSLPASSSLLLYDLEPAKIAESSAESSSPLVYDISGRAVHGPRLLLTHSPRYSPATGIKMLVATVDSEELRPYLGLVGTITEVTRTSPCVPGAVKM